MHDQWLGRPIAHKDDTHDLETRAAIHEFHGQLPRHQAEQRAHDEYVKDKRLEAAAHHLSGLKAAQGAGQTEEARKHGALYELHLKALGHEPVGPVPPEVQQRLQAPDRDQLYRFRAHKGDVYALQERPKSEEGLEKAEKRCSWKLGERRCKNAGYRQAGGRWWCHHHERHGQTE